ncbi:DUF6167 family protein [Nocardioides donggukensis]|uniref:Secreted protein n=1 Tax=Nocardioides donggukensis TaxID=2774019 RepID=A0A927PZU4_9ACTN|nr:DUF6167 family protein [Nocardioides donggukensis]MBD8869760.1 hypothetical protein [Nocardioides donggukensis]
MPRTFWFAAGAGAAVYAMNRARRLRDTFTPDGLRDRAGGLALGARLLADEVGRGRAEKEAELRERLGLARTGPPELTTPTPAPTTAPTGGGRHRRLDAPPEQPPDEQTPHEEGPS